MQFKNNMMKILNFKNILTGFIENVGVQCNRLSMPILYNKEFNKNEQ